MAESTNYQCPNCAGRLNFDGTIGKLKCEFCDSTFTAEEVERIYAERQAKADEKAAGDRASEADVEAGAAAASTTEAAHVDVEAVGADEDPVQAYLKRAKWDPAEVDTLNAVNCSSCGAQLMVDQVTAVTSCPYCGNNTVVPGQLSDILKPDYVIPFKLDKQAAIDALKNYYSGKKLLPNSFADQNHIEEIQGVYVPFWLYSGTGTGDVTFNGRNISTWSDSENNYTKTDHFLAHRVGSMHYDLVPADGSTKMPDTHMDAIEPYDYSEMVPFSVAYLPGFLTDRYDTDAQSCEERARTRIGTTCTDELRGTVTGYMEVDVASESSDVDFEQISYALLPVWMLHTKWNGEDFLFAMNGQTGKLIGDLPIDKGKVVKRFLMFFLPIAIVLFVLMFFLF